MGAAGAMPPSHVPTDGQGAELAPEPSAQGSCPNIPRKTSCRDVQSINLIEEGFPITYTFRCVMDPHMQLPAQTTPLPNYCKKQSGSNQHTQGDGA